MFENFGDEDSAEEFSNMSAEEYAERKGIEIIEANPAATRPRALSDKADHSNKNTQRRTGHMAQRLGERVTDLEDTLRDIYDTIQSAGTTREQMGNALDTITNYCTEAVPELAPDEEEADDEAEADDDDGDEDDGDEDDEEE
jgi:hypothetical protein